MALTDTSPTVREIYFRRLQQMTPSERINIGIALWKAGDTSQRSAARRRNPSASETEITFQVAVARFGLDLACKVYGGPKP